MYILYIQGFTFVFNQLVTGMHPIVDDDVPSLLPPFALLKSLYGWCQNPALVGRWFIPPDSHSL